MAHLTISVHVTQKWWVQPSISVLAAFYRATGLYPNVEKLAKFYADKGFVYELRSGE